MINKRFGFFCFISLVDVNKIEEVTLNRTSVNERRRSRNKSELMPEQISKGEIELYGESRLEAHKSLKNLSCFTRIKLNQYNRHRSSESGGCIHNSQ